jgi:hypothetical protein
MTSPTIPGQPAPTSAGTATGAPTIADAQLILQILAHGTASGADKGYEILHGYPEPPGLQQLRADHPPMSDGHRHVMAFLEQGETIGTFVKQGLLNAALVDDLLWTAGGWRMCERLCREIREAEGEPRLMENFEWLAMRPS